MLAWPGLIRLSKDELITMLQDIGNSKDSTPDKVKIATNYLRELGTDLKKR